MSVSITLVSNLNRSYIKCSFIRVDYYYYYYFWYHYDSNNEANDTYKDYPQVSILS